MRNAKILVFSTWLLALPATLEPQAATRHTVTLDGKAAQVVFDLGGGSLTKFHFQDMTLSPLNWGEAGDPLAPRPMGHFICFDRWGPPSESEGKNGMFFHGEASRVNWNLIRPPEEKAGMIEAEMEATLPMAGLTIRRRIALSKDQAVLRVWESVTNMNKLGRVYNLVQHATIGPPFLDETTQVDANARKGFMQSSPLPNPEEPPVYWPQALKDGQPVDLRRLTDDPLPSVVSFTIDQPYGWVTAGTGAKGLMIGYVWKTKDYPWLSVWRNVRDGKPVARGLEFGTTGLHQPFPILVEKGHIFGRPLVMYLDAGQTVTRSYTAFLFKIRETFQGVDSVILDGRRLIVRQRGTGRQRDLVMDAGNLLPEVE